MKLQACIGSSMSIMHIRDAETTRVMNGDLVLCKSTVAFKDYRGTLRNNLICSKCKRAALMQLGLPLERVFLGSEIGVWEVI